jgi:hypothetical protein
MNSYTQNNDKSLAATSGKIRKYGKTRNFKANKRIQMRFQYRYTDQLGFQKHTRFEDAYQWFVENLTNNVYYSEGFLFMPADTLLVHYSGTNYMEVTNQLIANIFNGMQYVKSLTLDQIVEMATLMSTVKMMTMKEHKFFSDAWIFFVHNFIRYARDLSVFNSTIDINNEMCYQHMLDNAKKFQIVIPYVIDDGQTCLQDKLERILASEKYGIIKDVDMILPFPPDFERMEQMIKTKKELAVQLVEEADSIEKVIENYDRYLRGFETEKVVLTYEAQSLLKRPPQVYKKCPDSWELLVLKQFVNNITVGLSPLDSLDTLELPEGSLEALKKIVVKMGSLRYQDYCFIPQPPETLREGEVSLVVVPEKTQDIIQYAQLFKNEVEFQKTKQKQLIRLSINLGFGLPKNVFYNLYDIMYLAIERRELDYETGEANSRETEIDNLKRLEQIHLHTDCAMLEDTVLDFEKPSTSKEGMDEELKDKSAWRKALDAITSPIQTFKSTMSKMENEVSATSQKIRDLTNRISDKLETQGFTKLSKGFMQFDTSTISSTLGSIKMLANSLFEQALMWVFQQFGFDLEIKLDISDLVITYILWVNTTSKQIKALILGYLAMQCGILDFFFGIIGKMATGIKDYFSNEDTSFEDELQKEQDSLQTEKERLKHDIEDKSEKVKKIFEGEEEDQKSLWDSIIDGIEKGSPVVLGLGVLAVAGYFSVKAVEKPNGLGDKVVKVCRNMSFIGLGLGAIANIIKHCMGILKVAFDYIKHYIFRQEDTYIKKLNIVTEFLKKANYVPGVSNYVFATDTAAAIIFMRDYLEIPKIDAFIHEIKDPSVRALYAQKRKEMTQMYGSVKAALQVAIQGAEIFHIQFVSDPGVGKTDLSQNTIKNLAKQFKKIQKELDEAKGIKDLPDFDDDTTYFGMESEKYRDLYYGQKYMIIDEMNFFKAEDPESIQFKLGLFSGKPTIANKAAIEDKGMLFNLNMVISNTNNPFPEPNDVVNAKALHRRRILVEAKVRPDFLTMGKIDDQKILEAGISRNNSEHLMFTILDPTTQPKTPINSSYVDLDYNQLLAVLKVKVEKHILVEESRLSNRAGAYSQIRSQIEHIIRRVENSTINTGETSKLKKEIVRLAEFIRKARDMDFSDPAVLQRQYRPMNRLVAASLAEFKKFCEVFDSFKTGYTSADCHLAIEHQGEDCEFVVSNHIDGTPFTMSKCPKCHFDKMKEYRDMLKATHLIDVYPHVLYEELDDMQGNEDTVLESGANVGCTCLKEGKDARGQTFVYLGKGTAYEVAAADATLFDVTKFTVNEFKGKQRALYEGTIPENPQEVKALLGTLRDMEMQDDNRKMKEYINKLRSRQRAKLIHITYMERLKNIAEKVYDVVSKALTKLFKTVLGTLGNGIQIGLMTFVAMVTVWGSLYGIGRLLAGKEDTVAYNKNIRNNKISNRTEDTAFQSLDADVRYAKRGQIVLCTLDETGTYLKSWINGFCVKGNIFMVPFHFTKILPPKVKLMILDPTKISNDNSDGVYIMDIKRSDFKQIGDKDAALVCFPKVRMMVSLAKKFITEEDLGNDSTNFSTFRAQYQGYRTPRNFNGMTVLDFNTRVNKELFVSELMDATPNPSDAQEIRMSSENSIGPTVSGDSGSLIIHNNTKMQSRFIAGMLVQRTQLTYQPVGVFITQEDLDVGLKKFDTTEQLEVCHFLGEPLPRDHDLYEVFDLKENVSLANKDRSISETSGFARTPIFGVFDVETEPAILNSKDRRIPEGARHPLKVSLNKSNGFSPPYISDEEREFAISALVRHYEKQFPFFIRSLRIYDTRDAIRGTKEIGSTPINIHSSAGLPYADQPGVSGKQPFIRYDQEQKTYVIQDVVYKDVQLYEHLYSTGYIPENMKLEFVKKELVGPNKIENPKTRTVGTGNMIHQIIYNKINKSLQLLMKNAWRQGKSSSFAMGVDMEQHGNQIAEQLKFLDYVFDYDVKAWESAINLDWLSMSDQAKMRLMDKAYASRDQKCRYDYRTISHALVVDYTDCDVHFKDVVYSKNSGLLSGHPGTFAENTNIHIMLIYLIAKRILEKANKHGWANSTDIYNNIKIIAAADDVALAVSEKFRPYITAKSLVWGYASLKFEITSADKTPEIVVKDFETIQFLKHMFKKEEDGTYSAYPKTSIIYQLMNWYRTDTKLSKEKLLIQNYSDAFRFSFFVGREFYENVRERFNRANLNNNIQWYFTYDEMRAMIKQDHEELQLLENSSEPLAREEAENYYNRFLQ